MQVFGLDAFRTAVERGFELAEFAGTQLDRMARWEILSPPQMGIVAFRYQPRRADVNRIQTEIVEGMLCEGFALLTSTVLRGANALRLCTINPRTTESDIGATLARLDRLARELDV